MLAALVDELNLQEVFDVTNSTDAAMVSIIERLYCADGTRHDLALQLVERCCAGKLPEVASQIRVTPVYLGSWYFARGTITTAKFLAALQAEAAEWTVADYNAHPCKEYFEPRKAPLSGYIHRHGMTLSIDHAIPVAHGGIDHPLNYVLMHRDLNSTFGEGNLELKWALLGRHAQREIVMFAKEIKAAMRRPVWEYLHTRAYLRGHDIGVADGKPHVMSTLK